MYVEQKLYIKNCQIHFYTNENTNGKALVFLHGASMDHKSFDAQMIYFSEKGYKVISIDLRGHGKSLPIPIGDRYDINIIADDIKMVLDFLDISKATVIGHSFGGYVAQAFAYKYPENVEGIVLLGCTDLADVGNLFYKFLYKIMPKILKRMSLESFRKQTLAELALNEDVKEYARVAMRHISKEDFEKIIMVGMDCLYMDCGVDSSYRIKVPFLLTHGSEDKANHEIFPKSAKKWVQKEKECEYITVENAGHTAHMDNPLGFNEILYTFLKKHNL